jgi:hypothetical protein
MNRQALFLSLAVEAPLDTALQTTATITPACTIPAM